MKRCIVLAGVALLLTAIVWPVVAQEAKPKPARKDPRGPLPTFYAQLGASDEQKDGMYVIHAEYQVKIDALAAQIKQLQGERNAKLDKKLTPAQTARLKELRDEAAAEAAKKKAASAVKKPEAKADLKTDLKTETKP